jgi:integrase
MVRSVGIARRARCAGVHKCDEWGWWLGLVVLPSRRHKSRNGGLLSKRRISRGNEPGRPSCAHLAGRSPAIRCIKPAIGNHSFRATGITAYLKNGGTLEKAAAMANHSSTRTTQLYDRRRDEMSLDEVERILV